MATAQEREEELFPGYPRGWFVIGVSTELASGDVRPIRYFARDLVLYRTSDGVAHVLDAFCPHLGAHLGHGGCLEDDKLVCPFPAWKFATDGSIAEIPYANKIPKKTRIEQMASETLCIHAGIDRLQQSAGDMLDDRRSPIHARSMARATGSEAT